MKLRPGKGGRSAVGAQGALQTGGDSPAVCRMVPESPAVRPHLQGRPGERLPSHKLTKLFGAAWALGKAGMPLLQALGASVFRVVDICICTMSVVQQPPGGESDTKSALVILFPGTSQ